MLEFDKNKPIDFYRLLKTERRHCSIIRISVIQNQFENPYPSLKHLYWIEIHWLFTVY